MNKKRKRKNAVFAIIMALVVLSIPGAVYAGEYLKNTRLNQMNTLTTSDINISRDGTVSAYISISKVYTAGSFTYYYLQKSGSAYNLKTTGTKKVATISTGVLIPSGISLNQGTYQIRLAVNASQYTDCRTDMAIELLRCTY